jgi:2'-5' RNA ligase
MRTFIAIDISEECRRMLDRQQENLRSLGGDVRWTAIQSIHLTLKFLGEVNPEILPGLAESLENFVEKQCGFSLRLHNLGCFPNLKNPRIIWCGIEGDTESLAVLHRRTESACTLFGFAPEDRPFHPHLTLGRVRSKRNLQPLIDCIKIGSDLECSFRVDHFNIYKSTLRPQGAVYSVLKTIALSD